jgi:hypothetical protein
MNLRVRTRSIFVLIVWAACACPLAKSVWAEDHGCKDAKGNLSVVNNGDGTTNGTITKGGQLDGPTQAVFTSTLTPTPDPTTLSYTGDFSATNKRGALKTRNVGLFDVVTGLFSEIARIDPNSSTEMFAGATGVLYINGKTTDGGATFQADITGEICFAH